MNPDFKELLLTFNAHDVEYLIVGAHALASYGHVRATKDMDVWVNKTFDILLASRKLFSSMRYHSLEETYKFKKP